MPITPDDRAESGPGPFWDPLADWSNDDILLTKPARASLRARHMRSLRVLDWPELRAQFTRYEEPANRNARRSRWLGVVDRSARAGWLGNRFWTERMRALYFQTLINNLGLVAEAMRSDAALGEWKAARARALAAMPTPSDVAGQVGQLAGAVQDDEVWVLPEWGPAAQPPSPSEELDLLLTLLRTQRFDSQIDYAARKVGDSHRKPHWWTRAEALALRIVSRDHGASGDARRYAEYGAAVQRLRDRFDAGDVSEKLAALREMEIVAYRDLRDFVAAHWREQSPA
jgi:hypothetical protein